MYTFCKNQKHYFFVMLIELIFLSAVYWHFFSMNIATFITYVLVTSFYITGFIFWIQKYKVNKHISVDFSEYFMMINIITLLLILAANCFITPYLSVMSIIFLITTVIFMLYYKYRTAKEKEAFGTIKKTSSLSKLLIFMSCLFLLCDFIIDLAGKLTIQLVLYLPVLFIILTFIAFIYCKKFSFKSIISLMMFANVYIISTVLLVLNYLTDNYFTFVAIMHFIIMFSAVSFFKLNSARSNAADEEETIYVKNEFMGLLFSNSVVIFVSLNNIISFNIPLIFINYLFLCAVLLVTYICYYNYKMLIKD